MVSILFVALLFAPNGTFLNLAYAADAYGNDILWVAIYQYNGTAWNLVWNITSSGGSYRVHDAWAINFTVCIQFNNTLASSTAEAIDYTRVYMNITDGGTVWNNEELNNTACTLEGDYYVLLEEGYWNEVGKPEAGVTYECAVLYQGYY